MDKIKEIYKLIAFVIISLLMMVAIPVFVLFFWQGIEIKEYFSQFILYNIIGFAGIMIMVALKVMEIVKKNDKTYGEAIIHEPDETLYKNIKILSFLKNPIKLSFIAFIFFSILSIWAVVKNQFFAGIPTIEMQITETAKVLTSTEPIASSETIFISGAILSLIYSGIKYLEKRNNLSSAFSWGISLTILPIIMGFIGIGLHKAVYVDSEVSLLFVFIFWAIGTFITVFTKTIYVHYIWHFVNNFFLKLNDMFSDEKIIIITISMLIVIFILGIIVWVSFNRKGDDKGG